MNIKIKNIEIIGFPKKNNNIKEKIRDKVEINLNLNSLMFIKSLTFKKKLIITLHTF